MDEEPLKAHRLDVGDLLVIRHLDGQVERGIVTSVQEHDRHVSYTYVPDPFNEERH